MSESEFHKLLVDFIRPLIPSDQEGQTAEFEVQVQPSFVSFAGQFSRDDEKRFPLDLRKTGKAECRLMSDRIQVFHRSNTAQGINRWNRARFTIEMFVVAKSEFIWDEELEHREIEGYKNQSELERPKWYWDCE